jgi:hypothetical protein
VILKYIKTKKKKKNWKFRNPECVSQACTVFERIVLWTTYGSEVQDR